MQEVMTNPIGRILFVLILLCGIALYVVGSNTFGAADYIVRWGLFVLINFGLAGGLVYVFKHPNN